MCYGFEKFDSNIQRMKVLHLARIIISCTGRLRAETRRVVRNRVDSPTKKIFYQGHFSDDIDLREYDRGNKRGTINEASSISYGRQ